MYHLQFHLLQPAGLRSGSSSACYSSKPLPDSHAATNCLKCMGSHGHVELTFQVNQQDWSNHLHHKTGTESKHHKSRVSCLPTSIMHDANINTKSSEDTLACSLDLSSCRCSSHLQKQGHSRLSLLDLLNLA